VDFSIPPESGARRRAIEEFIRARLLPRETALIAAGFGASEPELEDLRRQVRASGWWAPAAPAALGGLGLPLLDHAVVSEVLGLSVFGHYVFGCQAPDAGNTELLHRLGTEEQKRRFLLPLVRGEIRSCFAMTEPESPGSNPTELRCRARRAGGDYVLDGHKWFVTGADGARFAIVMAVTDPAAPPRQRATMFLVPTDTPGFRRVRNVPVMGRAGDGWLSHGEILLEACRVPAGQRLGEEGGGFAAAQERLGPGRVHHCMRWIGICERAFELMCARASARTIDGQGRLADQPLFQATLAECRARIDAARLLVLKAAWTIDQAGFAAATEEISLAKFFVAEVMSRVVDAALQAHGALGMSDDTPLAFYYAHERAARIYDGPDEVHKLSAGRRILKRHGR
jgi:alkylation response protein AidB-like acyl-CoA dehydrogenase